MSAVPNRAPKSGFAAEAQRKVSDVVSVYFKAYMFFFSLSYQLMYDDDDDVNNTKKFMNR